MMQSRLASFVAKLPEREVDAILVSGAENRRYLSGFSGSAGKWTLTRGAPTGLPSRRQDKTNRRLA